MSCGHQQLSQTQLPSLNFQNQFINLEEKIRTNYVEHNIIFVKACL